MFPYPYFRCPFPFVPSAGGLAVSINAQNTWRTLDTGVRLMDASGQYLAAALVQNNYFVKCGKGLALFGQGAAPLSPVVSCNTMESVDRGIDIEPNATVGDLGDPSTAVSNNYLGAFSLITTLLFSCKGVYFTFFSAASTASLS